MPRTGRVPIALLISGLAVVVMAAPAAAHIEPDPSRVKPGATATVAFTVEHGCDESPTTKLTFKIPKGVKKVSPEDKDGWETSVSKKTVVFSGQSPDAETEDTFSITFTAPKKKTILTWKIVQKCEEGEIRWIDTSKGSEEPPPRVGVGKDAPEVE